MLSPAVSGNLYLSPANIYGPEELDSCLGLALARINWKQCGRMFLQWPAVGYPITHNEDVRLVANSEWFSSALCS